MTKKTKRNPKLKPGTEYQVQIWGNGDEWTGWAHTDYDALNKADAERAGNTARQYGWKTRVILVRS